MMRPSGRSARIPADVAIRARTRPAITIAVALVLLAWLGIAAVGGQAQGRLSQVQQNDAAAFLPESAESTRADALARQFVPERALPALVILADENGRALSGEQLRLIDSLAGDLPETPLAEGLSIHDVLIAPTVVVPSDDGRAALIPVAIDADRADERVGEDRLARVVTTALRDHLADVAPDAGLAAHVSGPAGVITDLVAAFGGIDGVLLAVALVVVFAILVVVYRSPSLPITVLLTAVFALAAAALVVEPLARSGVLTLSGQSQGILSILVVGAATDYSLLLVARYREELTRHEHPHAALAVAWRATVPPIAASALTVIAGVLCLMLSDLASNASLGPVAAVGIVAAFVAALTLLPALLVIAGRRSRGIFWPRVPRYEGTGAGRIENASRLWERIAVGVTERPRRVWVVTALALTATAAFAPTFRASGTDESEVFLGEPDSVVGERILTEHFPGLTVQPTIVIVDANGYEEALETIRATPGIAQAQAVTHATGGGGAAPGGEAMGDVTSEPPLVVDGLVRIDVATTDGAQTQEATATVADLRDRLAAEPGDALEGALVGGEAAQRLDTQDSAVRDLRVIVPVVLLVITAVLVVLLRAVVAPLVLMAANVLSFGAAMGVSAVVFNHLIGFPGADATVPLFAFVFLIALGIDYTIFLMTRVREETPEIGTRAAVRRGLGTTGGVITSAGIVLAATFAALGVVPLLFLAQIAIIVPIGVLIDTLVVRTLLVPGLVHDAGRRVWWPWHRRLPQD